MVRQAKRLFPLLYLAGGLTAGLAAPSIHADLWWTVALFALSVLLIFAGHGLQRTDAPKVSAPAEASTADALTATADAMEPCQEEIQRLARLTVEGAEEGVLGAGQAVDQLYRQSSEHVAELEGLTNSVLGLIEQYRHRDDSSKAMMANAIADIQRIVGNIVAVSDSSRILGINARIEAAHVGTAGKGFAVIAQNLQELNQDVANATEEIQRLSEYLAESLRKDTSQGSDEALFLAAQESLTAGVDETRSRGAQIRDQLNDVMGHLNFQDVLRQRLESVENLAGAVPMAIRNVARTSNGSGDSALTALMLATQDVITTADVGGTMNQHKDSGEIDFF